MFLWRLAMTTNKGVKMKHILIFLVLLPLGGLAAEATEVATGSAAGLKALAAALTISLGALGGALAQGLIASAAMTGIARNPQALKNMFVPFIVSLAMVESLVLFCLVIAIIKT